MLKSLTDCWFSQHQPCCTSLCRGLKSNAGLLGRRCEAFKQVLPDCRPTIKKPVVLAPAFRCGLRTVLESVCIRWWLGSCRRVRRMQLGPRQRCNRCLTHCGLRRLWHVQRRVCTEPIATWTTDQCTAKRSSAENRITNVQPAPHIINLLQNSTTVHDMHDHRQMTIPSWWLESQTRARSCYEQQFVPL